MVHDPDGKENDDQNDGERGEKNEQVPAWTFFAPNVEKTHGLDRELKDGEDENNDDCRLGAEVQKFGTDDDQKGGERQDQRSDEAKEAGT